MASTKRLALIMPAFNEGKVIGEVLKSLPSTHQNISITKVVVDDGSTDDTAQKALAAGAKVIEHLLNTGSGGATDTGLEYARVNDYDYAVTIDADGQHSSKDCLRIIEEISRNKHDLVLGSRLINSKGMPWYRVLGNNGLTYITYLMFGLKVTDSQSGLKGFSRRALNKIEIRTTGMEFCSEIIWRAKQQKLKVGEVPIEAIYTEYSLSKGQSNWNAINIIKGLIKRKFLEMISA